MAAHNGCPTHVAVQFFYALTLPLWMYRQRWATWRPLPSKRADKTQMLSNPLSKPRCSPYNILHYHTSVAPLDSDAIEGLGTICGPLRRSGRLAC
eukprot:COSAG01_NODE_581_length_15195_cov_16.315291_17_plen_95_part_00